MKRLVVLVLAVFGFGAATFAGNNSSSTSFIHKMNNEKTFDGIASFIGADFDQRDVLHNIFTEAERRLEKATKNGVSVEDATNKAIYFNLGNARQILSKSQYLRLVGLVNLTIYNDKID
jgi:hypothetical protein